jgi:exonuclease SbcC
MRITRLYLRNYRVYEDELDLEVPPGLVGIYGVNGAGKSALLESVLWSIWGHSRSPKEEVRTAGNGGDCVTEVEFEHEGHLYLVRRSLSGINCTIRAQALADGAQVAEGVQSVRRYLHSVLGMDTAAFRSSVFAEQKQLSAFSDQQPGKRRELVMRLLGITPLDKARDEARRDARAACEAHDHLRQLLPDLDQLQAAAEDTEAAAEARATEADSEEKAAAAARERLTEIEKRLQAMEELRQERDALLAEGRAVREMYDAAVQEAARHEVELTELERLAESLPALQQDAAGLEEARSQLHMVEEVRAAEEALARLPVPEEPPQPPEEEWESARLAATRDAERLAEAAGLLRAAVEAEARAHDAVAKSAELSGEGDCPLCGRALGTAFQQVQRHRAAELRQATTAVRALEQQHAELKATAEASRALAEALGEEVKKARLAWASYQALRSRREAGEQALEGARSRLGRTPAEGEAEALAAEVQRRQASADACHRVLGRLERRPSVQQALEFARERAADAGGRLEVLREKVRNLGWRPDELASCREAGQRAALSGEQASAAARQAAVLAAQAAERAAAARAALEQGRQQHAALEERASQARHLGRMAELMSGFRNTVVAVLGPRLSAQAADLFAELTDHEYDRLEVDPETFEIQIRDRGRLYGLDRFSGSETDLANLALRVAISEHVRLLSGGAVGLLVLDEVFGPLDEDRKARTLSALERLRSRFRQILVVTHDDSIKAELPQAIEVLKLPGRRATARLVSA